MQEMLTAIMDLRAKCLVLSERMHEDFGIAVGDPPICAINMMFNKLTICVEVSSQYGAVWSTLPPAEAARIRQSGQDRERLMLQQRYLFVTSISSIEYVAKETARIYPNVLTLDLTRRPGWMAFVGRAHAIGMVDKATFDKWDALIKFRNALVHNNGTAMDNAIVDLPGVRFELREGANTLVENITSMIKVMDWVVEHYEAWARSYLMKAGVKP